MVVEIRDGEHLLAIIIPATFRPHGIHFVTPHDLSQQLAFMRHPAGKDIQPHKHNPIPREVMYTQEVLLVRKGKLRVDFYDERQRYIESRILQSGDAILLASGGHGFHVIEDVEMIEVKQGPHVGDADKTRFQGIAVSEVQVNDG